jgi:hypothetical protein
LKHAWHLETDGTVDPVHLSVCAQKLQQARLRGVGRIAALKRRIRLMKRNDSARAHEPNHLCKKLLGVRHIDQNEPCRRQVECARGKAGGSRIDVEYLDVREMVVDNELASPFDLLGASFHTHDMAGRTRAFRQQAQTALWTAPDLYNAPTITHTDRVKDQADSCPSSSA